MSLPPYALDNASFPELYEHCLVGMSQGATALSEEERTRVMSAIVADSLPRRSGYAEGDGIAFAIATNVATARG